jgi:hypothetical protein
MSQAFSTIGTRLKVGASAALKLAILPVMIAVVVALFQLVVFHWLVSDIVRTGELRHKATAMHKKATWSCNYLIGKAVGETCLPPSTKQFAKNTQ